MLAINKTLSAFRLSNACHRTTGLRWIGQSIDPLTYYKWLVHEATASYYCYPADWRRTRYLRQILHGHFTDAQIKTIAMKNILHRHWSKALTMGWPSWAERYSDWVAIEGNQNLRDAQAQGKGAILLSGHSFGFNSLVAPVLSQTGFRIHRTGRGHWGSPSARWGRDWSRENWEYHSFGNDFWQHVQALKNMQRARRDNEVIHILATGFPDGSADLEIDFYYNRFFLDPTAMRVIETLKMPVLPCFATCDLTGRLLFAIHPPLDPSRAAIMKVFGPLYSRYLKDQPEYGFFWRKIAQQKGGW